MIVVLLGLYIAILALFIWLKFIPFNTFWKISPLIVLLLLNIGLFIPMGWGAPQGPAAVVRNSVQIVPSVAGEVIEVPVTANTALKSGEVLFRIDPTTYQATVNGLEAQLRLAQQRLSEITELQTRGAGRQNEVEQRQSEVDQLKAQLDGAQWNLDKTTVRAPADGYVTNLGLRTGARVTAQSPVMAFIDTSETILGAEFPQINARYVKVGQPVEVTFKIFPGEVFTGRVEAILQAIASGQAQTGGTAVAPRRCYERAVHRPVQARRSEARRTPAGRQHRHRGDLHRSRQGRAHHPRRDAAADRDPELHQSVLTRTPRPPFCLASSCPKTGTYFSGSCATIRHQRLRRRARHRRAKPRTLSTCSSRRRGFRRRIPLVAFQVEISLHVADREQITRSAGRCRPRATRNSPRSAAAARR